MRRRGLGLVALALLVAVAGCSNRSAATDGDLTNHWPAFARADRAPHVGNCYDQVYLAVWYDYYPPVDCRTQGHYLETVYVGAFTAPDADRATPPADGSPALAAAFGQCQQGADAYLGGDWHSATVWLGLVVPDPDAWGGGERWFRCDLTYGAVLQPRLEERVTGSLRGDLTGTRRVAYGCIAGAKDDTGRLRNPHTVDCAQPHVAEYAGVFTAPASLPIPPGGPAQQELADRGCRATVAAFLGYPSVQDYPNPQVLTWAPQAFDAAHWALGDRAVPCFAYAATPSGTMTGSVRGIHSGPPHG
jgi:hypothetical protein